MVKQAEYTQVNCFYFKTCEMLVVPPFLNMQIMDFILQVRHIQCVMW